MSRIITPEAMISYPYLFKPQPKKKDTDKDKYSATLVFLPGTDISALEAAAWEVAIGEFGSKAKSMIDVANPLTGTLKWPFRRDGAKKGYPEGSVFINVRSNEQPQVASIYPSKDNPKKPALITDPKAIWAGCFVKASISPFYYSNESKGISFGLNNVQLLRTGERIDGKVKAEDEFETDLNAAPADLAALGINE